MVPKEILSAGKYHGYRRVRIAAWVMIFLGCMLAIAGAQLAFDEPEQGVPFPPAIALAIGAAGVVGVVAGVVVLQGSRQWAPLVYVMAIFFLLVFPFGTMAGLVMLSELSRYFDSLKVVREASTLHPGE
ncbi:hypothetical protein AYO44_16360 [Planctomycetaceae bacterium SCGC AG-212-F19]|nr:hypothetical protein AYO44_16360 [Planctomycetaceae bacterium SCGC AG-212-F19]